jgi:hypothetical protein
MRASAPFRKLTNNFQNAQRLEAWDSSVTITFHRFRKNILRGTLFLGQFQPTWGRRSEPFKGYFVQFGDIYMTNVAANANLESVKQIVIKEIRAKWGKFSEQDLSSLKSNGDLVTQLAAKYSLDKSQAQRDVDAFMKGRQI